MKQPLYETLPTILKAVPGRSARAYHINRLFFGMADPSLSPRAKAALTFGERLAAMLRTEAVRSDAILERDSEDEGGRLLRAVVVELTALVLALGYCGPLLWSRCSHVALCAMQRRRWRRPCTRPWFARCGGAYGN